MGLFWPLPYFKFDASQPERLGWCHSKQMDKATRAQALIHIVEDDTAIRESLKLLLETRGYAVDVFASGDELLAHGDLGRCDCMILDINLPGRNGFEIVAALRRQGVTTPAIFMSGRGNAAMRAQAQTANAVAFFDKPVRPVELLSSIACALGRS
jgi:FixJ family two-component response regulator